MTVHVAKNTAFLTLASVGQKIIAFVYFLFVARIMMPEATGEYFIAISITVIFTVVADMGITAVVIREVAKDPSQAAARLSQALSIKLPLLVLSFIGAIVTGAALGYDTDLRFLITLACIVLSLDAVHLLFYGVLRGFQLLRYEAFGVFAGQVVTGMVGGLVLWLHPTLPSLIIALVAGSFTNVLISGFFIIKRLGTRALVPTFASVETKKLVMAAIPFALAALFVKTYSYIDSILISKFLDTTAVGIYSIAYKFTYAFQFLPLAFTAALYPAMSAVVGKDPEGLERIFLRGMWYMAMLATPIVLGLWAIAPEVVLLAGREYEGAAIVLQVLIFVLLPIFLDFPIGSLLNASGRQSTKTAIMGATMMINVVLNILLIPRFGILGAAYAAFICFICMFLLGMVFVPQILPTYRLRHLFSILVPIFISGGLMLISVQLMKPIVGWIAVMPLGALVYILALFITKTLHKNDVAFLFNLIRLRV